MLIAYGLFFIVSHILTNVKEDDKCNLTSKRKVLLMHKEIQLVPNILTIVWITIPAISLKRILKRKIDDTSSFRNELRKIHCTNLVFILSIIYEILLFLTVLFTATDNTESIRIVYHDLSFTSIALPSLFTVSIVLYNHFTSMHSVTRILKMLWEKEEESDSNDGSIHNQVTIHLPAVDETTSEINLGEKIEFSDKESQILLQNMQQIILKKNISDYVSNKEFEGQSDENIIKSMVIMKRGAVKAANDHGSMIDKSPPKSQIV